MWTLTPFGFFSAVRKHGDAHLTIRARVAADLDALRARYLPTLSPTIAGGGTDYRFRATCIAEAWGDALAAMGRDIDYANFKDEVAERQGKARATVYGRVWTQLLALEAEGSPAAGTDDSWGGRGPAPSRNALPGGATAGGGVVMDEAGRVLMRLVAGGFDGEGWTWAKGRPEPGESLEAAALREVREELGVTAEIVAALPGEHRGRTTVTRYWRMRPVADHGDFDRKETEAVEWVTADEARRRIRTTTRDAVKVARDLAVLEAALAHGRAR
jgi:8-oxo-dGTP pyrophosphatase MutT (NUDIX family)